MSIFTKQFIIQINNIINATFLIRHQGHSVSNQIKMEDISESLGSEEAIQELAKKAEPVVNSFTHYAHLFKVGIKATYTLVSHIIEFNWYARLNSSLQANYLFYFPNTLVSAVDLLMKVNKWVLLGLSAYAGYRVMRYWIWQPLRGLTRFLIKRARPLQMVVEKYRTEEGDNLVIINNYQGESGKRYYQLLTSLGFKNFIMISHSQESEKEFEKEGVKIQWIQVDAKSLTEATELLKELIKGRNISFLVNCVFKNPQRPVNLEDHIANIELQVAWPHIVTQLVIRHASQSNKTAIIQLDNERDRRRGMRNEEKTQYIERCV